MLLNVLGSILLEYGQVELPMKNLLAYRFCCGFNVFDDSL